MALPTPWRVVHSLDVMLTQLNSLWPFRAKGADGAIAGPNAGPNSDHWPHRVPELGGGYVVTARDITHDPLRGPDCGDLVEALRASRDPRLKYVIWNRRIFSNPAHSNASLNWGWRTYTGSDPHTGHAHISVRDLPISDSRAPWRLSTQDTGGPTMSEWHDTPGDTTSSRLTQGVEGIAGHQRDTALAFAWKEAQDAAERAGKILTKLDEPNVTIDAEAVAAALVANPAFAEALEAAVENVAARVGIVIRPSI